MSKFTNPLYNIKIASPCSADWNEMMGDERKRYCGDCKLNVYNLSEMTKAQAENLIVKSEGSLCVRFYRRADGTILTKDCPVGWQKVKNRMKVYSTAAASLIFSCLGAIGLHSIFAKTNVSALPISVTIPELRNIETEIEIENKKKPIMTMSNVSITNKREYTLSNGGVSNLAEVGQMIKTDRKR